jgi:chromosome segregation ATPase
MSNQFLCKSAKSPTPNEMRFNEAQKALKEAVNEASKELFNCYTINPRNLAEWLKTESHKPAPTGRPWTTKQLAENLADVLEKVLDHKTALIRMLQEDNTQVSDQRVKIVRTLVDKAEAKTRDTEAILGATLEANRKLTQKLNQANLKAERKQQRIEVLTEISEGNNQRLRELASQVDNAETQARVACAANQELEVQNSRLGQANDNLQRLIKETNESNERLTVRNQRLAVQNKDLRDLVLRANQRINESQARVLALESSFNTAQGRNELKEFQAKLAKMESRASDMQRALKECHESAKAAADERKGLRAENHRLTNHTRDQGSRIDDLTSVVRYQHKELDKLKGEKRSLESQLRGMFSQSEALIKSDNRLRDKTKSLEAKMNSLKEAYGAPKEAGETDRVPSILEGLAKELQNQGFDVKIVDLSKED